MERNSFLSSLPSLYILLPTIFVVYYLAKHVIDTRRNLLAARQTGIPYVVVPWDPFNRISLLTTGLWLPVLRRLPDSITQPWLVIMRTDWPWHVRYSMFKRLGSDTFIVVSARKNSIHTCDPDVIHQTTSRRLDFPKPVEMYGLLKLFGANVVTAEGADWRRHRKITAPQFNEKSNEVVWRESLYQAQEMMRCWDEGFVGGDKEAAPVQKVEDVATEAGGESRGTIVYELSRDTMKVSLHVISRAGFGVRCLWPSKEKQDVRDLPAGSMSPDFIPKGHVYSYVHALELLLRRIISILLLPKWVLRWSGRKYFREASVAYDEWGMYMREIYDKAVERAAKPSSSTDPEKAEGLDLMGAMVKASTAEASSKSSTGTLTPEEIIGNAFVMFIAGHETAANSLYFTVILLAMQPSIRRKLQADLDLIFGDLPIESWDYATHLPRLFAGWAGAIMNEELRVVPPALVIPKCVPASASAPQPLRVNGRETLIAPGTTFNLITICTHRNPRYWPAGPPREGVPAHPTNVENDLDEFKPERWFVDASSASAAVLEAVELPGSTPAAKEEEVDVDTTPDTAETLFRPKKGAYIPFSEGPRSCVGRRFAQVEILAVLAAIYKTHSVELVLDPAPAPAPSEDSSGVKTSETETEDGKEEKEGERKQSAEKEKGWEERAKKEAWSKHVIVLEEKLRNESSTIVTLQMRGKPIPLRFVKRGEEEFDY